MFELIIIAGAAIAVLALILWGRRPDRRSSAGRAEPGIEAGGEMNAKKIAEKLREIASFYGPDDGCTNAIYDALTDIANELDPPEPKPEPLPMASTHDGLGNKFMRDCLKPNEHPIIAGYNRLDYVPVEGIRVPEPEPKPTYKVGDWVEHGNYQGIVEDVNGDIISVHDITASGRCHDEVNKSCCRKLAPSEVKVTLTLEGTVSRDYDEKLDSFILNHADGHTRNRIRYSTIDPATCTLVKNLLKAQEEK